jgi:hypothetical protein
MTKRKIKPAYSRTRVQTKQPKEHRSKVLQSERDSSDINNIMARAHKTGQLPVLMGRKEVQPLPDAQTYQDCLNKVVFAQQAFEQLPSNIRTIFENDPKNLLSAISQSQSDDNLKAKLQEIGILERPPAEQSGEAASGGEATAEPQGVPAPATPEGSSS